MPLAKIKTVAAAEFIQLARTKSFLLGILLVPVFSLGLGTMQRYLSSRPDTKVRTFAVWDKTGLLFGVLQGQAARRQGARFVPVRVHDASALAGVARGEIFAYVEIDAGAVLPAPGGAAARYYSDTPSYGELKAWLDLALNDEISRLRYRALGIDDAQMRQAQQRVPLQDHSLSTAPGQEAKALVPALSMLLLFLMVMLTAPQMMSSVIEEKMSRISEILLSSATPFELMMGKLAACSTASALVGAAYLMGGLGVAHYLGYSGLVSWQQIAVFFCFLVLAVFLNGSLYLAVGAACSQPKDAQALLAPLVLVTMAPLFALTPLMRDPSGGLAVGLSFFPLSAPFVMCFRLLGRPAPPWGDLGVSVLAVLAATLFCVWAASRIFRIGLLSQGRAPGPVQLLRWIFMK